MNQTDKSLTNDIFQNERFCLLFLFVFIFLVVSPIIFWGIPDGFDLPQHFQFAQTYYASIKSGDLFPGWSAHTNYGYGDVGIRFYPPLAHYFLAITQFAVDNWQISAWLNILFWMFLAGLGGYYFARLWLSPQNSLLAGILYTIAPYHLSQIYQFFLYSEFVAAAILPFCFLYLTKLFRNGKWDDALKFGIFCALLILSHIPTTLIGLICFGVYSIAISDWNNFRKLIPKLLFCGVFPLILTAFYWVRFITEINWVNHSNPKFSSGLYDYKLYLFPIYLSNPDLYFIKQLWLRDIVTFTTIIFVIPLVLFVFLEFRRSKINKEYFALSLTSFFAIFMSSSLSAILWTNLPILQKIQFPFRWLSAATILGVLSFTIFFQKQFSPTLQIIKKYSLISFLTALSIFNISQIILPAGLLTKMDFNERLQNIENGESFDCWWTIWGDKSAFDQQEPVSVENRSVNIKLWDPEHREFEIIEGNPTTARISTFYYPHWEATVNGEKTGIELSKGGTMSIVIPPETVKVSLIFQEPLSLKTVKLLSFLSWILLALAALSFGLNKYRKKLSPEIIK